MLGVFKYHPNGQVPKKANIGDAGFDLFSVETVFIPCGKTMLVDVGIAVEVPEGMYGKICDRSSMASKGMHVGGGVIDSGFAGPIKVILTNLTCVLDHHQEEHQHSDGMVSETVNEYGYQINAGDKVAQLVFHRFENVMLGEVKTLWKSIRGTFGLGSSGK